MKDVSVIIPCFNEFLTISDTVKSIRYEIEKTSLSYEIIVVDNGSTDGSDASAIKNGAFVLFSDATTVAAVRNDGVRNSTGKVLVFLDADVVVTLGWGVYFVEAYNKIMNENRFITGSHPCVPRNINRLLYAWYSGISKDIRNTHLGTGHMIVSKIVFDELCGFDEFLMSGEDFDFCNRAKGINVDIISEPRMVVFHYGYPNNFRDFVEREVWHGMGDCISSNKFIKSKVALSGFIFIILNLLSFTFLFIDYYYSVFFIICAFGIAVFVNVYKFGIDTFTHFIFRNIISYLYLMGRGISPFYYLFKKLSFS